MQIAIIGLGLIGGSIAKALRANIEDLYIIACDINKASLAAAFSEGIADAVTAFGGNVVHMFSKETEMNLI